LELKDSLIGGGVRDWTAVRKQTTKASTCLAKVKFSRRLAHFPKRSAGAKTRISPYGSSRRRATLSQITRRRA